MRPPSPRRMIKAVWKAQSFPQQRQNLHHRAWRCCPVPMTQEQSCLENATEERQVEIFSNADQRLSPMDMKSRQIRAEQNGARLANFLWCRLALEACNAHFLAVSSSVIMHSVKMHWLGNGTLPSLQQASSSKLAQKYLKKKIACYSLVSNTDEQLLADAPARGRVSKSFANFAWRAS